MYKCIHSIRPMFRLILTIGLPNPFSINHVRRACGLGCCSPYSAVLDPGVLSPQINQDQVLQRCRGQRPAPTGPNVKNQGAWCAPGGGGVLQYTVSPTATCNSLTITANEGRPHPLPSGLVSYCRLERRKDTDRRQMPYK